MLYHILSYVMLYCIRLYIMLYIYIHVQVQVFPRYDVLAGTELIDHTIREKKGAMLGKKCSGRCTLEVENIMKMKTSQRPRRAICYDISI